MVTTLYGVTVLTPKERMEQTAIIISDEGRIAYVGSLEQAPRLNGPLLDLRGLIVAPGLIDMHVHGGHGVSFGAGEGALADLRVYSEWVVTTGVVGFVPSLAAPDAQSLLRLIRAHAQALEADMPGAEALGLHLEGPFINAEKRGAFCPTWVRSPSMDEARALLRAGRGWIRQITLAPELPGAEQVARLFRAAGVVVAMGHTNADYDTAIAALRSDWTHVTHTFNAQRGFEHREPGALGAVLSSEQVTAELIADLVHVHPAAIKILVRCLGSDRVVLVTDAVTAAGLPDGTYELLDQTVFVRSGQARLADGTFAGSTARLNQCVHNMHQQGGVALSEAVQMASLNPARAMGLADRLGSMHAGKDASLVVLDEQANVRLAMVRGKIVYLDL
ncbi:MAG: N-acetylglucosamine-6-phosphate deacetylase [Chloroflexi bacterium]|nr:N-acetylglucosamine-6-phosphate deacetylase [Chloroflexota bacterium]